MRLTRKLLSQFVQKSLFTPGPLNTTMRVKQTMLVDLGSREGQFVDVVKEIRQSLLDVAGVSSQKFTTVPVQGAGTFAIESVFCSCVKPDDKVLIIQNGVYSERMAKISRLKGHELHVLSFPDNQRIDVDKIRDYVSSNRVDFSAIAHCETGSGILNDVAVEELGPMLKHFHPTSSYFVDAMSTFGAVPLDMTESQCDYLVSSANKCLEGVPGFAYVIANLDKLKACEGVSKVLSFDLFDQLRGLEKTDQFRFTPATHTMIAFREALRQYNEDGGLRARMNRYKECRSILHKRMGKLGFKEYLKEEDQSYIITAFHTPNHVNFNFDEFYNRLADLGLVIYPGKLSDVDCFRIGSIGVQPTDMIRLVDAIERVLIDMKVDLPVTN